MRNIQIRPDPENLETFYRQDSLGDKTEMEDQREDSNADLNPPQPKRARTPPAQNISPLLINHILEQIFFELPISDLANFRLVCREWNNVATQCLQNRLNPITIGCRNANHIHSLHYHQLISSSTLASSFLPASPTVPSTAGGAAAPLLSTMVTPSMNAEQLNRFIKVMSKSTNPPFIKFEILSSFFAPENQRLLHSFFSVSSSFIQFLKISLDNQAPGEFDPQFLTGITFPKLKSIVFEVLRQFTLPEPGDPIPQVNNTLELRNNAISYRILSTISGNAPTLESLEVSLQRKCDGEGQPQYNLDGTPNYDRDRRAGSGDGGTCPCQYFWLSNVAVASASVKCHLPIPVPITPIEYSSSPRITNSPKLKKLHLRLRNSFIHQTCVTLLLERLIDTLEELCFTEEGHGSGVTVEFPKLTKLSTLTISSVCEFEQNFVTILPFSYAEQLPNLREVNLWNCFGTEKRYKQLFLSSTPSQTLTKLVLPSQFRNVTLAQRIATVFPALKSLTLVFSTRPDNLAVIETVFQTCGESLEELHFITDMDTQNQVVDHVLTGLPKEICRKMRMEESFALPPYFHGSRKASLVNLKRLKRLIFQLEHRYSRAPLITDVTGYLAFMEMPSLEYLRFTRYGMSWDCCQQIAKKCRTDILSPYGNNVFEMETFEFDFEGML